MGKDVLEIVKKKGFVTLKDLIKELNQDSYIVNALLNFYVEKGFIRKIDSLVGSNPIFFIRGFEDEVAKYLEEQIEKFLNNFEDLQKISELELNSIKKKKEVLDKIKEKKVLTRDELSKEEIAIINRLYPLVEGIIVKVGNKDVIVYKYYKTSREEVIKYLKEKLKEEVGEKEDAIAKKFGEIIEKVRQEGFIKYIVKSKLGLVNIKFNLYIVKELNENLFRKIKEDVKKEQRLGIVLAKNIIGNFEESDLLRIFKVNF